MTQNCFLTMKTNIIIAGVLLVAVINSCSPAKQLPDYLPNPDKIDVNQYGSYIQLLDTNGTTIKGELIAIDTNQIVVLKDSISLNETVRIPIKGVSSFELRYARHKNYGATIPLFSLSTVFPFPDPAAGGIMTFHGYYSAITLPINLIVTIAVTRSSATAFLYSNKEMTFEKLKMFARFPQGIPPNINIADIK